MGVGSSVVANAMSSVVAEAVGLAQPRCKEIEWTGVSARWSEQSHAYKIVYGSRSLETGGSLWQRAAGFAWQLMGGRYEHDFIVVSFRNDKDDFEFNVVLEQTPDGKKWTIEPADFEIPIVRMEEPFNKPYAEVRKIFDDYESPTCSLLAFDCPHGLHR
ncbi:hypothetical protein M3Y99_00289600 [Aphelenchoides fujianensis]|nr:hypothetical protein M3Y99_00289600 [Aphelenchoides fujianensis]